MKVIPVLEINGHVDFSMNHCDFEFVSCLSDQLPKKSSSKYQAAYQKFIKWCEENNVENYTENALLDYFSELKTTMKMKSSSMWSLYSMIKHLLNSKHGVDMSKYLQLREYLKKQNEGYIPKKPRGFTRKQYENFLSEASDIKYLGWKIVMIIGVSGGCNREEMVKMEIDDVEDLGSSLHIKITGSETNKARSFTVVGENSLNIYRKYISLRPVDMTDKRFFLKYVNGKCYSSVIGINKIARVPKEVAAYLKLPHWEEYNGYCFKRTSIILLEEGEVSY